jgi:DNA-binding protein HU-beta
VNKSELIDAVADKLGLTRAEVTRMTDALLDEIKGSVAKGEKVAIAGFGSFEAAARAARKGVNPFTGEKLTIKATKVPKFKAGADFKGLVSGNRKAAKKAAPAKKAAAKKAAPAKKAAAKKTAKKAAK